MSFLFDHHLSAAADREQLDFETRSHEYPTDPDIDARLDDLMLQVGTDLEGCDELAELLNCDGGILWT